MNLPVSIEQELFKTLESNKMLFEPWVETASNYNELSDSIKKRGYKNIPSNSPIHEIPTQMDTPSTNIASKKTKTMLRKKM
jgi:hypothetical protein